SALDLDLGAAVHGTAISRRVVGNRLGLPGPYHRNEAATWHTAFDQIVGDRMRTALGQFLVVGISTHTVGMSGDGQAGAGRFLLQSGGNGVQSLLVGGSQAGGIEFEVHVADDDDLFLLYHHLLDRRRCRWAAVGIDLYTAWRARALV